MMEKGSKCRWGNFVGIVIFPLWVRCEDDPLEYVRKAKSTMDMKRISMEALILYGLVKCIMKIFGDKVQYEYQLINQYIYLLMYM